MERIINHSKKFNTVSLFAGIGGFDLGFEYAGFNIIWANDFDKYACETYRANVGDHIVCGDIRIAKDDIPSHDVLIGGFPCQPFSISGKQQGFEDTRGTLFFDIARIAEAKQPKILLLENVYQLEAHDCGRTLSIIMSTLESIGYDVYYKIMNSADFGFPQNRKRIYIVGFRKDMCITDFEFPAPSPIISYNING